MLRGADRQIICGAAQRCLWAQGHHCRMGQSKPIHLVNHAAVNTKSATQFMDEALRAVVDMHEAIAGDPRHLDVNAFAQVAIIAERLSIKAMDMGCRGVEFRASEVSLLARQPLSESDMALRRARLGQLFFALDREISACLRARSRKTEDGDSQTSLVHT